VEWRRFKKETKNLLIASTCTTLLYTFIDVLLGNYPQAVLPSDFESATNILPQDIEFDLSTFSEAVDPYDYGSAPNSSPFPNTRTKFLSVGDRWMIYFLYELFIKNNSYKKFL
jgi:hypothetical protein